MNEINDNTRQNQTPDRIVSTRQVADILGVHTTTIDRWHSSGMFVEKIRLGPARVGYSLRSVQSWLAARAGGHGR